MEMDMYKIKKKKKENTDMAYFFEDNLPGIYTQNFCLCIFTGNLVM